MVKGGTSAKREQAITAEAFDQLLGWLDPDRERAGERYEEIRRKLIKIFIYRGCQESEELADETINRVIKRIDEVADGYTGEPALYFYGVAQNVYREYLRRPAPQPLPVLAHEPSAAAVQAAIPPVEDTEQRHECLEECLRRLPAADRELIVEYYAEEKQAKIDHRKQLTGLLQLLPNTLRRRTQRIRERLRECIGRCLESAEARGVT